MRGCLCARGRRVRILCWRSVWFFNRACRQGGGERGWHWDLARATRDVDRASDAAFALEAAVGPGWKLGDEWRAQEWLQRVRTDIEEARQRLLDGRALEPGCVLQ
jgi:hypothetical protein